MNGIYRIIDANINRASEGLRVLEDISRFYYNNYTLCEKLKKIRHSIRKNIMDHITECLNERDPADDVGMRVSKNVKIDNKSTLEELTAANFKRVQEALRVIEESLKLLGQYDVSKMYEEYRFTSYMIEKEFFKMQCGLAKKEKLNARLYCLTSEEHSRGRNNIEVVKAMIKSGVKIIQYREKEKSLIEKYNECLKIRELTKKAKVTFIVNDDVHIAMMVKADGIHIGQDDLPVEKVRELVGEEMIIGVSTHSPEQAQDAVRKGADYIGVGPIYRTYTKKDVCDPVGLEYLDYVVKNIDIPFVAIGGIKEHNMHEVLSRGAKCIAMVTEIVEAQDIERKILNIRRKLGEVV